MKMQKRDLSPEFAASLMRCAEGDIRLASECGLFTLKVIAQRIADLISELNEGNQPDEIENPYERSEEA